MGSVGFFYRVLFFQKLFGFSLEVFSASVL